MASQLAAARAALASSDEGAALLAALDAWRTRPKERIKEIVFRISERIGARRPPIDATSSMHAAWLARAARNDPADVPALLEVFTSGRAEQILGRIDVLASRPADPRVERAVIECLVKPPLAGKAGRSVTRALFELLRASPDPELHVALRAMVAEEPPYAYVRARLRHMAASVWKDFETFVATLPPPPQPPPLSPDELAECSAIERLLAEPRPSAATAEELLAAVYADPQRDEARLVYADWLLAHGDPRGELITLQCERERTGAPASAREKQLLKQYARRWAEPLSTKAAKKDLVFRRGFVAECSIMRLQPTPPDLERHPIWSTVEVMRLHNAGMTTLSWANRPELKSLRAIEGVSPSELHHLERKVEKLGVRYFSLANANVLEHLSKQDRLRELELDPEPPLHELFAFLNERMPSVERLVVPSGVWERGPSGWKKALAPRAHA